MREIFYTFSLSTLIDTKSLKALDMDPINRLKLVAPWTPESLAAEKLKAGQIGNMQVLQLMKKELVSMDKVVDRLYISGFYGLTQENLDNNRITHAINCDSKCPNI